MNLQSYQLLKNKLIKPASLKSIAYERLTEPVHLNLASLFVAVFGSFKMKVEFDLIFKQPYAWGILRAATQAKPRNLGKITVVEVGVAGGGGLLSMCNIARQASRVTGVEIEVVGFDGGTGMPAPVDYRDHPDCYREGDYPMDMNALKLKLPPQCSLWLGNFEETIPRFLQNLEAPIGFVAIDVDYYSSTKKALALFNGDSSKYLRIPMIYFDDIWDESHNRWAGEFLAINEFNLANRLRKLEPYQFLRSRRLFKNARWIDQIYAFHLFDSSYRNASNRTEPRILGDYYTNGQMAVDRH